MKIKDWIAEGKRLFGDDFRRWRFQCPSCGHVQTPQDFIDLKEEGGLNPNIAYYSCIGRWSGHMHHGIGEGRSPCNYSGGGLLQFNPVEIEKENGDILKVFEFAKGDKK